jgi:hypothetical protein
MQQIGARRVRGPGGLIAATERLVEDGWRDWIHLVIDLATTPGLKAAMGLQQAFVDRQLGRNRRWFHQVAELGLDMQIDAARDALTVRRPSPGR